ncbi:branched-chain amino acid ABC transporter permease [Paracoccus suum]|uniref:Branched-chain amino acid ABC transporter permease n=1 Tax=Paracoccus suum TaxID=2259340 RepID=A0A344PLB9_9RHOB|nr:branched-chain amino acid ABC transporter permease [Paracoccus suum]AXC50174.1 branched-chain amino acid ABC transporter permease [Paracoccus suum]
MTSINKPLFQFALAVLVAAALPIFLSSGTLASEVLIFAIAAAACNLLLGYTGLLSIGQGVFFGIGSYTLGLTLVHTALSPLIALAFAVVLGAIVAIGIGWLAIRRQGVYFVMLTLAFAQFFYFLAYTFSGITGGDNGLLGIPRSNIGPLRLADSWTFYGFVAVLFLLVFAGLQRVASSTFGRTLLAIRDNGARAQAIGFPVRAFKIAAFAISGGVTGLAGGLHALLIGIAPLANIDYHLSESLLIMTIIGGTGSLFASVLGAGFFVLVSDTLSAIWPRWLLLLGVLLIALALFMQKGIWGLVERLVGLAAERRSPAAQTPADRAEEPR